MADSIPNPHAELALDSILSLAPKAQARMIGSTLFVYGYQLAGVVLGLLVGELLLGLVPVALVIRGSLVSTWPAVDAIPVACGLVGWSFGLASAQKHHQRKFLAGIRRRGTPDSVDVSYTIAPDGLLMVTSRVSYRIAWEAILEIVPSPEGWLIQVDLTTFQLPRRAFATPTGERDFMRALLDRMGPEVRERSTEAVAFTAEI